MEIFKEFLVLPINQKKSVAFLSTKDEGRKSWSFEVDWNHPVNKTKPKLFLEIEPVKNVAENQETASEIQNIAVSNSSGLLAFTTNDKTLFTYRINDSSAEVLSRRIFLRASSVIRFSSCGKQLFLADKTGDTFVYSCDDVEKPGTWIFGHISQILDLQISSQLSYIVTSDRDEKVRVTNYPQAHEIEAFCVGHKEFVSSVAFFDADRLLMSASGDKTLRFWNYMDGKEVQRIELDFVPITVLVSAGLMAISSNENVVYIYTYEILTPSHVKIQLLGQKPYVGIIDVVTKEKNFYIKHVTAGDDNQKLLIDLVTLTGDSANFELLFDVTKTLDFQLESNFKLFRSFDISLLFKKKFDNIKQYIDRKKARIETQEAKRNKA